MTTVGPVEAAKALTSGSVLRRILAEGGLYMSMFCFLVSLHHYIWMVYSGPDICPSYRGAASFCARQGRDLYEASAPECQHRCREPAMQGFCHANVSSMDCLCQEVCQIHWESEYDWYDKDYPRSRGVQISYYHFFGYRTFGARANESKPAREKIKMAAASLMCNHKVLEDKKEECFRAGTGDCTQLFLAWEHSEECMESAIQDAESCSKVCSWEAGRPPREGLRVATQWAFIPLGITLLLLTLGRVITIIVRALTFFQSRGSAVTSNLRNMYGNKEGEEEEEEEESDEERSG